MPLNVFEEVVRFSDTLPFPVALTEHQDASKLLSVNPSFERTIGLDATDLRWRGGLVALGLDLGCLKNNQVTLTSLPSRHIHSGIEHFIFVSDLWFPRNRQMTAFVAARHLQDGKPKGSYTARNAEHALVICRATAQRLGALIMQTQVKLGVSELANALKNTPALASLTNLECHTRRSLAFGYT